MRRTVVALAALVSLPALAGLAPSRMAVPRPDTLRAMDEARAATELLAGGESAGLDRARVLLRQAVSHDPLLAGAWVNLAVAEIRRCDRTAAMFAAVVARKLDPGQPAAANNLKTAEALDCATPAESGPAADLRAAEVAACGAPDRPEPWVRLAALQRTGGERGLAVLFEEFALAAGAEAAAGTRRIAADLQGLGLWRAAVRAYGDAGSEADRAAARALATKLEELAPRARSLGEAAAASGGIKDPVLVRGTVDIAEVLLASGMDAAAAQARLADVVSRRGRARFSGWWGEVTVAPEWTAPDLGAGAGSPELLLRRFPGDTQVALYAWPAGSPADGPAILARFASLEPALVGAPGPCAATPVGAACRAAVVEIDVGVEGRARIDVSLVGPDGAAPRFMVVALSGAGGAGAGGLASAQAAVAPVLGALRLELVAKPPAEPPTVVRLPVPAMFQADRLHREREDPWRRAGLGGGLVVDLPPGIIAVSADDAPSAPQAGPATRLLVRGAFADLDGREIVIGDETWYGWVDIRPGVGSLVDQVRGGGRLPPPRNDPGARFVSQADLRDVLAHASAIEAGVVARFSGDRFPGTWLVSWLRLGRDLVELALPASSGAGSPSLLWTALTVRQEDAPGLPPPADTSSRYSVRYVRPMDKPGRADPRDGFIDTGELQLTVPKGFRVSLSPSSHDGYPVTLRSSAGTTILLERQAPSASGSENARRAQAELATGARPAGWATPRNLRGARLSLAELAGKEGEAWVLLVVPEQAKTVPAFRVRVSRGAMPAAEWTSLRELVIDSLRFRPAKP